MRAMILAAGLSTRLWPLTIDRAKPAMPFLGKPLVGYVAEYLAGYGYDEVLVNLHHRPESVCAALGDGSRYGVKLHYISEPEILGTSGAWDNARALLEGETFLAINGKIITDIDLAAALSTHRQTRALATLVLRPNYARERFTIVETEGELLKGFGGTPTEASDNAKEDVPLMFTGIQILDPRIFSYIPRGRFSHSTTDVYPLAIAQGERIAAHVATRSQWYELSTIERYVDAHLALLHRMNKNTQIGADARIGARAFVSDAVLWNRVTIEDGAQVNRVVIGDDVVIRSGETIANAAVVRADLVRGDGAPPPAKALPGYFHKDNFIVPFAQ